MFLINLINTIYTSLLLITTIILIIKYKHLYWKRQKIPYIQPTLIYGNVKHLLLSKKSVGTSILEIYKKFRKMKVKFGGFYMLTAPALLILDPVLIKNILTKDFAYFHDRNVYSNVKNDPLSGHLFAAECTRWRTIRQRLTTIFSSGKIKKMLPIIDELAKKLSKTFEKNCDESVDIKKYLGFFSLDVIAMCVFGININALDGEETDFYKYSNLFLTTSMSNNFKMAFGMFYSNILRFFNIKTMNSEISEFFLQTFKQNLRRRIWEKRQKNDFVDLFLGINCQNNDKPQRCVQNVKKDAKLEFNDLAAQAFLFFIAGYETSTQTLVFCLYELSLNKKIQHKLRDEIRFWLQKSDEHLDYETIMSMEYLDQVIKETLRKYPAAPVLNRKCTKNYKIQNNCVIEKGTPIWISILGLHMDPKYYKNPEKFDPGRFDISKTEKNIYLPFGIGPRNCIGIRFALLQIKTTLVSLLLNFQFDIDVSKTEIPIKFGPKGILLNTEKCIYLKIKKNK